MKTIFVSALALCFLQVAFGTTTVTTTKTVVVKYESRVVVKSGFEVAESNMSGFLKIFQDELLFKIRLINSLVLTVQNLVETVIGNALVPGQREVINILATIGTVVTGATENMFANATALFGKVGQEIILAGPTVLSQFGTVLGSLEDVFETAIAGGVETVLECLGDILLALQAEVTGIVVIFWSCVVNPIARLAEAMVAFRTTYETVLRILNPLKVALIGCRGNLLVGACIAPAFVTAVAAGVLTLPALVATAAVDLIAAAQLVIGSGVVGQCLTGFVAGKLIGLKGILDGGLSCAASVVNTGGSVLGAFGL